VTALTGKIETLDAPEREAPSPLAVVRMTKPEAAGHAEMLEGGPDEVASKVAEILATRGLL